MSNSRRRIARVDPGTPYTAGDDLVTITPAYNCILAIEIAVSAAAVLLQRIDSQNLELNDGVPIPAARPYTIYTMASPSDPVTLRLDTSCTIRKLYVDEIDTDV